MARIGFVAKFITNDPLLEKQLKQRRTTVSALSNLTRTGRGERVRSIVRHNLASLQRLMEIIALMPAHQRFFHIGSDLLPVYTHADSRWIYDDQAMRDITATGLREVGSLARKHGIRLVMHAGTNVVSADAEAHRSRLHIEYLTDIMRAMGFANGWHADGATICVRGVSLDDARAGLARLSEDARRLVAIENDDRLALDQVTKLGDVMPVVPDLHSHWVRSGEHIPADHPLVKTIVESWRGVRPYGCFGQPREGLPTTHANELPRLGALVEAGVKPNDLRARSERLWNNALNEWACQHLRWMDIEVEAKGANLAAQQLVDHAVMQNYILPELRRAG